MRWRSILSTYPIITFNNFFYSRKQLLTRMLKIVSLLTSIPLLFTKKGLVTPCDQIAVDTMTFLDNFFVKLSKFSSGFLSFTICTIVLQIDRNFKNEIFSSCQTVFSIIRMLLLNLSLTEPARVSLMFQVPSLICCVFQCLNYLRYIFFTILYIDDKLIPVCLVIFLGANEVRVAFLVSKPTLLSKLCFLP